MDWNSINTDSDTSGLGPIEYDQSKVPQLIRKHADNVRGKTYGQQIREAQARNAEYAGLIASEAKDVANEASLLSIDTQKRFDIQVAGNTDINEVIDARLDSKGVDHGTLRENINALDVKRENTIGVYVTDFGVIANDPSVNNHDAIMSALEYAVNNNIATVVFPVGETYTSPISLEGYTYIKFKGQNGYNYADFQTSREHRETSIRFLSYAEYGIQTASSDVDGWKTFGVSFEDITLHGDKKVKNVVNGRYNTTFKNVVARGAIECGIVLEPSTYPVKLEDVHSNYNGTHGLWARSPFSTVYSISNSEFSRNDGYGLLIEASAGTSFTNITVQDNKQGGVKINSPEDASFTKEYWIQALSFGTLYTEANGTLESTDVNYEGNYALLITGVGAVKPSKIAFYNTTINASSVGKAVKVDYADNVYFDLATAVGRSFEVNNDKTRVNNIRFSPVTEDWQVAAITYYGAGLSNSVLPTPYVPKKISGHEISGAWIGSRGRTTIYEFYNKDIETLTLTEMNTFSGSGRSYHCHDDGSILGVHFTAKNRSTIQGKFTISIEKRKLNNGTWSVITNDSGAQMVYTWDTVTANDMLQRYLTFNDFKIKREEEIRITITSQGHVRRADNNFTVTLLVEY